MLSTLVMLVLLISVPMLKGARVLDDVICNNSRELQTRINEAVESAIKKKVRVTDKHKKAAKILIIAYATFTYTVGIILSFTALYMVCCRLAGE